ncbi:MAG: hypothetical protein U0228_39400 [Myxococcaceae bacterium]
MKRSAMTTARLCFRAAAELEASVRLLTDSAQALEAADDDAGRAAASALHEAMERLKEAKAALQSTPVSPSIPGSS